MKRGISAIVATVLIVLVVVAAIAIVWVALKPIVEEGAGADVYDGVSIMTSDGYTVWDRSNGHASVQVKREADDGELKGIEFVFGIGGRSSVTKTLADEVFNAELLEKGDVRMYVFDLNSEAVGADGDKEKPTEIEIVPVY
jgi:hypothetical protein